MSNPIKKLNFSESFFSDIDVPNMLFGVLIRSPFPIGKIKSIDFADCVSDEEKKRFQIITAKDIQGKNEIEMLGTKSQIFCSEEIHYKGEVVGLLLGENEIDTRRFLDENKVVINLLFDKEDFDDFGKNTDYFNKTNLEKKLDEKSIIIKEEKKSESFDSYNFKKAESVIESEWSNKMQSDSIKETNGALAVPFEDKIHIYAPNHWISNLNNAIKNATGLSDEKIFLTRTKISIQNTNAIWINEKTSVQASVAALKTNRPVKIVYSRKEQNAFIENVAEIKITHKTSVSNDGKIIAMDVKIVADVGYENPFSQEIAERLLISSLGIYKPEHFKIQSIVYKSKNPPSAVKLSAIAMHTFFAVENQIQKITEITEISPKAIRKLNINDSSKLISKLNINEALNIVTENLDSYIRTKNPEATKLDATRTIKEQPKDFETSVFERKYCAFKMLGKTRTLKSTVSPKVSQPKGIALACAIEGNGYKKRNLSLKTELKEDGKFVIENFPISPTHWGLWTNTVSQILKLDKSYIWVTPSTNSNDWPDTLCENVSIKSKLLKMCCEKTLEKLLDGTSQIKAQSSLSEINNDTNEDFYSAAFATCVVEVEIDPCIFKVQIEKIYLAIDCGRIFDRTLAEMSAKLEIQKILSQLFKGEKLTCDDIKVNFVNSTSEPKQIGHLIHSVLPAAFTSAVSLALGRTISKLPISEIDIQGN